MATILDEKPLSLALGASDYITKPIDRVERVAEKMPSVILLDLMMPEMDGFAFLSALRESMDGKTVPVIVVSALELSGEDRRRLSGGVQQILQKGSYSPEVLLDELRGALSASSPQQIITS